MKLTKPDIAILEKAFEAEVNKKLPFQSKSKRAAVLLEEGYLQPMELRFGGPLQVVVKGFQLTHLGRLTYCANC